MNTRLRERPGSARETDSPARRLREPIRSVIEPLLAERRREVADQQRRQRVQRLKIAALIGLALVLTMGALLSPLFDIDHVRVSGGAHLSSEQIEEASGLAHGTPLVIADVGGATAALRNNPWISYAKVRRSYPGTMLVDVAEERPVLVLRTDHGSALVSANGRIIEFVEGSGDQSDPPSAADYDLTYATFDGRIADGSPDGATLQGRYVTKQVTDLVRIAQELTPVLGSSLDHVAMDSTGDLNLLLRDGARVLLGPPEELTAKLSATESVLGQVQLDCLAVIDVRNPTRATVTRADGCTIAEP